MWLAVGLVRFTNSNTRSARSSTSAPSARRARRARGARRACVLVSHEKQTSPKASLNSKVHCNIQTCLCLLLSIQTLTRARRARPYSLKPKPETLPCKRKVLQRCFEVQNIILLYTCFAFPQTPKRRWASSAKINPSTRSARSAKTNPNTRIVPAGNPLSDWRATSVKHCFVIGSPTDT